MDLADLVPSLKRALAAPGEFDTTFAESTDDDLTGTLADAVAECQLDGFLGATTLDVDTETASPDLTHAQQALVILYAMSRVLTARVSNTSNRTHYKAGNVEADAEQSASIVVELLRETRDRKKQILDDAKIGNLAHAFAMADMYVVRSIGVHTGGAAYDYRVGELL